MSEFSCRLCKLPVHPNNLREGLDLCTVCRRRAKRKARGTIGQQLVASVLRELNSPRGTSDGAK